jgi:hypothetical protein
MNVRNSDPFLELTSNGGTRIIRIDGCPGFEPEVQNKAREV